MLLKTLFKISGLLIFAAAVFLVWPPPKVEQESRVLSSTQSINKIKRIVLVYNATADHWSVLKDFVHKIVSPKTYPCKLCNLTFGVFTMKKEWKLFLDSLPYEKQFLHKDEFQKKYSLTYAGYPVIFAADEEKIWLLVSKEDMDNCRTLQQLKELARAKLQQ